METKEMEAIASMLGYLQGAGWRLVKAFDDPYPAPNQRVGMQIIRRYWPMAILDMDESIAFSRAYHAGYEHGKGEAR